MSLEGEQKWRKTPTSLLTPATRNGSATTLGLRVPVYQRSERDIPYSG
jgi:hypothetical protein